MDLINVALVALGIIVVLLITLRLVFYQEKESHGLAIGKSMTIGNREIQGDHFITMESSAGILAVLADGRGDAIGGRIASRLACDTFADIFQDYNAFDHPHYYYKKAFHGANRGILRVLDNEQRGAASVGAALLQKDKLYYAVVGNVKIAVFRGKDLVPLTEGHTVDVLAHKQFRQGNITRQDALTLLNDHRLYNYVGQEGFKEVELYDTPVTIYQGDVIVLMSDGVYEQLSWREIEAILSTKQESQAKAFQIIEAINQKQSEDKDNASVVLIQV